MQQLEAIFVELNRRRAAIVDMNGFLDIGKLLAGWFDGRPISPDAAIVPIYGGYDVGPATST